MKAHYGDPFGALLGLLLKYIQYNYSKSIVDLILGIDLVFGPYNYYFYKINVI
jgi:hypothetical protein